MAKSKSKSITLTEKEQAHLLRALKRAIESVSTIKKMAPWFWVREKILRQLKKK